MRYENDFMTEAYAFRAIRKKNKLSQTNFASRLEVTVDTVRGVEHGRWRPSSALMHRLSAEFSEPELDFCGGYTTLSQNLETIADDAVGFYKNLDFKNAYRCTDMYLAQFADKQIEVEKVLEKNLISQTNMTWMACVGRMLYMTRNVNEGMVDLDSVRLCMNGVRIGGYKNFDPYDTIAVHLTYPAKQLLNLCGLIYMRLGNYNNAMLLFKSLFLCLQKDSMSCGAREDIKSQMAMVECNIACAAYLAGMEVDAANHIERSLDCALHGAASIRIGEILEHRSVILNTSYVDMFASGKALGIEKYYYLYALSLLPKNESNKKRSIKGILML